MTAAGFSDAPWVRMYRQGLGDCFLVTLPRTGGSPFRMLIDCGVLLGTPKAQEQMELVATDIAEETGGHLDVVVATHEHWDHVSGFYQARATFDRMTIGEVWMAWTEDPADATAERLRAERGRALRGLRATANRLGAADADSAKPLHAVLDLFGAASGARTRDALDCLIGHPSRPRLRYHRPGNVPLELPGTNGSRVYVLGPPRDAAMLRRTNSTKSGREVYEFAAGTGLFAAAGGLGVGEEGVTEDSQAFEARYRVPRLTAEGSRNFNRYFWPGNAWRQINSDWLNAAEQLALALDNQTNNTSLALAIELEPGGRVLLFPGDAQVGNWLSWEDYRWHPDPPPAGPVTISDLLSRTVLYKVGHHASHNATLREKGLELMSSPELVAMIPVSMDTAGRMGWAMPFPALLQRLRAKAQGRILQSDSGLPERPPDVSEPRWESFVARVRPDPHGRYVDCALGI